VRAESADNRHNKRTSRQAIGVGQAIGVEPRTRLSRNQRLPRDRREKRASPRTLIRFLSVEPLLEDLGPINLDSIHWVIVGGESGAGARPMDHTWVQSIRDQCAAARVPFFFKQWGGRTPKAGGRLLEGKEWNQFPMQLPRGQRHPDQRKNA
jgi:protein gp37